MSIGDEQPNPSSDEAMNAAAEAAQASAIAAGKSAGAAKASAAAANSVGGELANGIIAKLGLPEKLPAFKVSLSPPDKDPTKDEELWKRIKKSAANLSFEHLRECLDRMLFDREPDKRPEESDADFAKRKGAIMALRVADVKLPFSRVEVYRLLKAGTDAFMQTYCRVLCLDKKESRDEDGSYLLYRDLLRHNLGLPSKYGGAVDRALERLRNPCAIELIWSYWLEEGMLVQTMGAISLRFQNRRDPFSRDPLSQIEISPLRPLNNLLWGYIQDEQHRLALARRAYEYLHHYGLALQGRAVPPLECAERRDKFMNAFHILLNLASRFYVQDDDRTVHADGFPVLNALKEVQLLLSEGAGNQYGDLPWTARVEMMMQQYILARPEMHQFLPIRETVAYPEGWMASVDAMKRLQGWDLPSALHYGDLAKYGEELLLSIRARNWTAVADPRSAANWARFWRSEVQTYIHAYRTVSGADLSADRVIAARTSVGPGFIPTASRRPRGPVPVR